MMKWVFTETIAELKPVSAAESLTASVSAVFCYSGSSAVCESYVSLNIDSKNDYWLHKRMKPTSKLTFTVKDEEKAEAIKKLLESK